MAGTTHSFGITAFGIYGQPRRGRGATPDLVEILRTEVERQNALFLVVGGCTDHAADTPGELVDALVRHLVNAVPPE